MMGNETLELASKIIEKYKGDPTSVISILLDFQDNFNYLPKEAIDLLSESMNIPLPQIYGIATFFKAFSLKPKGKYAIHVCMGTSCHVRGADRLIEKFEKELGIKTGDTTKDLMFSLHKVYCLGCCALAPVVKINEDINVRVAIQEVPNLLRAYKTGEIEKEKAEKEKGLLELEIFKSKMRI